MAEILLNILYLRFCSNHISDAGAIAQVKSGHLEVQEVCSLFLPRMFNSEEKYPMPRGKGCTPYAGNLLFDNLAGNPVKSVQNLPVLSTTARLKRLRKISSCLREEESPTCLRLLAMR